MKERWVRPGFVLALLTTTLAAILAINWPMYSPERFVRQLRLTKTEADIALNHPKFAWVRTNVTDYWDVEPLLQQNGSVRVRIVIFEQKNIDHPWLFERNRVLGPRSPRVEWLRVETELPGSIPQELWHTAMENPDTIFDLPVPDAHKAAMRLHATGEAFAITTALDKTWVAPGENGLVVWMDMRTVSTL